MLCKVRLDSQLQAIFKLILQTTYKFLIEKRDWVDVPDSKKERTGDTNLKLALLGTFQKLDKNRITTLSLIFRLPNATLLHLENAPAYHVFIFCGSLIVQKSPSLIRRHVLVSRDISGIF